MGGYWGCGRRTRCFRTGCGETSQRWRRRGAAGTQLPYILKSKELVAAVGADGPRVGGEELLERRGLRRVGILLRRRNGRRRARGGLGDSNDAVSGRAIRSRGRSGRGSSPHWTAAFRRTKSWRRWVVLARRCAALAARGSRVRFGCCDGVDRQAGRGEGGRGRAQHGWAEVEQTRDVSMRNHLTAERSAREDEEGRLGQ